MKKISVFVWVLWLFCSCSQEKEIQKTSKKSFFKEESSVNTSAIGITENNSENPNDVTQRNTSNVSGSLIGEIMSNNIPRQLPNKDFPDWQSFSQYMKSKKAVLSNAGQQYCSDLFLRSYQFTGMAKPEKAAVDAVVENMELLINSEYKGYELMYNHLLWLKLNDNPAFSVLKYKILSYAKPVLPPPNPALKNDPQVEANPELKAELDKIINRAKRNDSFIEQIRMLL
jgi:hypothetical protein